MAFPSGTPVVTLIGNLPSAAGGAPFEGRVVLTPSAELIDSARHAVYPGGGRVEFTAGAFSIQIIPTNAAGIQPTGWRWQIDVHPRGGRRITFWAAIDGANGATVHLDDLVPVPAPGGGPGTAVGPPGESAYDLALIEGFDGTVSEWLASLQGAPGPKGDTGDTGPQPPLGAAGAGSTIALRSTDPSTTNARPPTSHASTHSTGGSDAISPASIGAELAGAAGTAQTAAAAYTDTQVSGRVPASRQILAGTGLTGGGNLSADRTLSANIGTTAGTVAAGDDARFTIKPAWVFDITASPYGAVGDAQVVGDGVMASGSAVLTSATAAWPSSVVGKAIAVKNAGPTGVTTLLATVASRQSTNQITLTAANASGGAVSGAVIMWGTDDTAAIQAAVDAAETYLATHTYAQVYIPPRAFIVAGALSTAKSGNGQIVFGVYPTTSNKRILEFRGESDGAAAVRHWMQTVPQNAGSCLISLGVYASTSAQIADLNLNGNPAVISGPNEGTANGLAHGAVARFSNLQAVIKNLSILTTHSAYGLTYGALNLYGVANVHLENVGYGTAGIVTGNDYSSPGTFGAGLSVGLLLPAPGNNDHIIARNISCGGGYTYGLFLTEHAVVDRCMVLYCWAGLCAVGSYAGSVGSVHAMDVISASVEACSNELYIVGGGSSGVGPTIYANISTESGTPTISGNSTGAMNSALGKIRLTGLFTEAGVSVTSPSGIEVVNGQVPRAIKRKTTAFTCSPIDRVLICDTTSAGFVGTLPAADFNPVEYVLKNVGVNDLTVATTSGQLIYASSGTGATTATVTTGQTIRVQALYNGSTWGWYAV